MLTYSGHLWRHWASMPRTRVRVLSTAGCEVRESGRQMNIVTSCPVLRVGLPVFKSFSKLFLSHPNMGV